MRQYAKERCADPTASYECAEDVIADKNLTETEKEYILKSMAFEADVLTDKDEDQPAQGENPVNIDEIHKALDQLSERASFDKQPAKGVAGMPKGQRRFSAIVAALSGELDVDSKIVEMADGLAQTCSGKIVFVSVIQPEMSVAYIDSMSPIAGVAAPPPDAAQSIKARVDERRAQLRKTISDVATEIGAYTLEIRQGDIIRELLHASNDAQADLIIVGSHDRNWFEGLLSPETAHRVAKGSVCPVLIVPE